MNIHARFTTEELCLFRCVNENAQAIFEITSRREVDEAFVAGVKAADEAGDDAGRLAKTKIDTTARLHIESRIANDELKCRVVRAAREKFFCGWRALRVSEIESELPVARKVI